MGKVISTLKGPCMGERGTEQLRLEDVAVGRKELGYQYPLRNLTSYSLSNSKQISPSYSLTHWAIKFGSFYYHQTRWTSDQIRISVLYGDLARESFCWEKMGTLARKESEVVQLIEEINEKRLTYNLLLKNCQHAATAIGNFAMGLWDKQKALDYYAQ